MNKAQYRSCLRERLQALTPQQRKHKSRQACHHLIHTSFFQEASMVMMYLAMSEELDLADAMRVAWEQGKEVVVPLVSWRDRTMIPVRLPSLDEPLIKDAHGLWHPEEPAPVPVERIDLVVTPGLGFDTQGHRLGRGGGFYDRFFAGIRTRVLRLAVAFSEQVLDDLPVDDSDEPVDGLVTEQGLIVPVGMTRKES